ncbi:MAG: thiazole synthase, partial [Phycisphaerales bacterium]
MSTATTTETSRDNNPSAMAFAVPPLTVAGFTLKSRLVTGTGKYRDYENMQRALDASGCDAVTVAVR